MISFSIISSQRVASLSLFVLPFFNGVPPPSGVVLIHDGKNYNNNHRTSLVLESFRLWKSFE